jgi:hypothetical protein
MANKRISELDASTGLSSGDLMVVVDADTGSTQKATISQAFDYVADAISVGSAAGDVLTADGAGNVFWSAPVLPSPAEPLDSIQFNDAGSFGGSSGLRWVADQIRVGGDDAGFLGNDAVFFAASVLSPPQYAGNEVGLGYSSSVGGSPATYLKLGSTGDTGILQLQGSLGISPGLSLRYTNNEYPVEKPLWIDADGGPINIGNNSSYYLTTKVVLGSSTTPVRISDAFEMPTADGLSGDVLTTDGYGNLSWSASAAGTISGSGTATQIAYFTGLPGPSTAIGSETAFGSDSFTWDSTNNRLGIGTAAPSHIVDVQAGSVANGVYALNVDATMMSGGGNIVSYIEGSVDAGFPSGTPVYGVIGYLSGAGIPSTSYAGNFSTTLAGNGADPVSALQANFALLGSSAGTTVVGHNVGVIGLASNSSARNYGLFGNTTGDVAGANVAVTGMAKNGSGVRIGGLFASQTTGASQPTVNTSAVLIADNMDLGDPIFLARDGGTTTFSIGNNGYVTSKNTSNSTTAFQVQNAAGTTVLDVDTTNGRVGIGTPTPSSALEVSGVITATAGVVAPIQTNAQSASYVLALSDSSKMVEIAVTGPATATVTVPANGSVPFPIGTQIIIAQTGTGAVSILADVGVTINYRTGLGLNFTGQWAVATVVKRAADTWVLFGDLV